MELFKKEDRYIENVIAEVYRRKPLWDPSEDVHKNVSVLKKLWEQVAEALGKDGKAYL